MNKLVTFWWVGAVAVLGTAGVLFFRQPPVADLPAEEVRPAPERAGPAATEDAAPTAIQPAPEQPESTTGQPDMASTGPAPDQPAATPAQPAPTPNQPTAAPNQPDSLAEQPAPAPDQPATTRDPQAASLEPSAPPDSGPESALAPESVRPASASEENSGPAPEPETTVATAASPPESAAPAALQPGPALGEDPTLGAAPAAETAPAGAPMPERAPLLGASAPPLSLAQVLPPGAAPNPGQIAPSFDLVRVAPDGSAIIAGRAAPGANVQVFSGNIPIAEATTSARGEFVVFLDPPETTTLDLQIPAPPEGAQLVVSQDDIVILPPAPEAGDDTPLVLRRTPDAVQIVQPSGPAIPGNVSLDLVSYSDQGAVQLAGRGQPGNIARIYTDNRLVGEAPIAAGGNWALEVDDIEAGRYVLRVDEISPDGAVASRTESPFQRQFPEAGMPETFSQGARIIVQPGNTLWLMATEAYGKGDAFTQIFSANKDRIRDPDLIYPGQIFSIPRIDE